MVFYGMVSYAIHYLDFCIGKLTGIRTLPFNLYAKAPYKPLWVLVLYSTICTGSLMK